MDGSDGATPVRCHALATVVTDLILALTREQAVDGMVSLADIERIAALVRRGTMTLDSALKAHEERCRKDILKPKGNLGVRSDPFQRLMVQPFEHLLGGKVPILPRPYLTNYFTYIRHVIGKRWDGLEQHCLGIVQALLAIHGNNLTWDHFYDDPRTVQALTAALLLLANNLETPEGRKLWFAVMARPVGNLPKLEATSIDTVMAALLFTSRGLSLAAQRS